jgi:hypothetical protein
VAINSTVLLFSKVKSARLPRQPSTAAFSFLYFSSQVLLLLLFLSRTVATEAEESVHFGCILLYKIHTEGHHHEGCKEVKGCKGSHNNKMGNSAGKAGRKLPSGGGTTAGCNAELAQPGQPKVSLASLDREIESEEVSDEVVLTWKPCTKRDKSYDIEMWDLGLQEWVHVSTTKSPECTLSNILSGILYRFRVTALTSEGGVSFPSDPSEPFVIDIPGVQVNYYFFSFANKI